MERIEKTASSITAAAVEEQDQNSNAMNFWKLQDQKRQNLNRTSTAASIPTAASLSSPAMTRNKEQNLSSVHVPMSFHDHVMQEVHLDKEVLTGGNVSTEVSRNEKTKETWKYHYQNENVGEMQIKLDIAAAKLLTEEMKYADMASQYQEIQVSTQQIIQTQEQNIRDLKSSLSLQQEYNQELVMEIQRLHELHQAERQLYIHHSQQQPSNTNITSTTTTTTTEIEDWKQQVQTLQSVNSSLKRDLQILADESERLEHELEAVTEDRDDLLRRHMMVSQDPPHASGMRSKDANGMIRKDVIPPLPPPPPPPPRPPRQPSSPPKQQKILTNNTALQEDFILDISSIDILDSDDQHKKNHDPEIDTSSYSNGIWKQHLIDENKKYRQDIQRMQNQIQTLTLERDNLKVCLADAMQELEEYDEDEQQEKNATDSEKNPYPGQDSKSQSHTDVFFQELMQMIREKDIEIAALKEQQQQQQQHSSNTSIMNTSHESFHEDVAQVVDWMLNSSNRLKGSSSSMKSLLSSQNNNIFNMTQEEMKLPMEDEQLMNSLNRYVRDLHISVGTNEAYLANMKRQIRQQSEQGQDQGKEQPWENQSNSYTYDTSTEASFERGGEDIDEIHIHFQAQKEADLVCMRFRVRIKTLVDMCQKYEKDNEELRQNLAEAADLVKPLKDHVLRIDNERASLEYQLADKTQRLVQLERDVGMSNKKDGTANPSPHNSENGLTQVSWFDLRRKDDEIIELRIQVDQLKQDLKRYETELSNLKDVQETFSEMPTPTKHNISGRKMTKRPSLPYQSSTNEEENVKMPLVGESEIISRLELEVNRRRNAEETVKSILRDTSLKLMSVSARAEELSQQKEEAENKVLELQKEVLDLEENLQKALESRQTKIHLEAPTMDGSKEDTNTTSNNNINTMTQYKDVIKEITDRNDQLTVDVINLKAELKSSSKGRKRLKKSLEEAVSMLNALRSHVETAEVERKKLKKHLRVALASTKNPTHTTTTASTTTTTTTHNNLLNMAAGASHHEPDPDGMANQTTIIQLRTVVVEMEHEICNLEERIEELERINNNNENNLSVFESNAQDEKSKETLEMELKELKTVYTTTKERLEEVSEINREMLADLKQTEEEASVTWKELERLKHDLNIARDEMDDCKYLACAAMRKLDVLELGYADNDSTIDVQDLYGSLEGVALSDCIGRIDRRIQTLLDVNRS